MKRIVKVCIRYALIAASLGWAISGYADSDDDRLEQIKAGYLLNFIRFTEWADEAFYSDTSPIVVAVIGPNPFSPSVRQSLEATPIHNRSLQLKYFSVADNEAISNVHVVYFAGLATEPASALIAILPKQVLSIGDHRELADVGVMLTLSISSNGIIFYANSTVIRDSAIKLSSKVLRLANELEGE